MAPLLSVIIPIYNGAEYVENIFNAFSAQGSNDFELICIDDGSTDDTLKRLFELQKKQNFEVKIEHQENAGVSSARNRGLSLATGKYISFFDCDDYISKDYLDVLKNCEKEYFDIFVFQSLRTKFEDIKEDSSCNVKTISNLDMLSRFINNPTKFGVYNMFVKREFYNEHKFLFCEGLPYYEDYELLYRVFALAKSIVISERKLYFYILRDESAMQRFNKARVTSIKAIEDLRPFVEKEVPDFLDEFDYLSTSRLYWSVMWQACLAFSHKDAKRFFKRYDIASKVVNLKGNDSLKVSLSTRIMLNWFGLYYLIISILGKKNSNIRRITLEEFDR